MTNYDKWINFLKPDNLKSNLTMSAFYIALFESLKDYIISSVQDFYMRGFDESGYLYSPEYEKNVLSRNKSQLYASLNWLKESDAITNEDVSRFERQKSLRNKLAHDMLNCLVENNFEDYTENLYELMKLRITIEKWWIINVDIPSDSDFDQIDVNEADITTGSQIMNKIMLDIITGKEDEAEHYYNELVKNKPR